MEQLPMDGDVCRDITEMSRDATQVAAALFRYVQGSIQSLYLSDRMCALAGTTRERLLESFTPEGLFGLADEKTMRAHFGFILGQEYGVPHRFTCPVRRADGQTCRVRFDCLRLPDGDNTLIYVTIREIAEEAERLDDAQWQSDRYRFLSEAADVDLFDYDPINDVLSISMRKIEHTFRDYSIERFLETLDESLIFHPNDRTMGRDILLDALRREVTTKVDIRMQKRELGYRWNRVSFISVADAEGRIVRLVGQAEDIQEEKEREKAIAAKARIEAAYLRSIFPNAVLAIEFDLTSDMRLASDHDVYPAGLPDMAYEEFVAFLRDRAVHPEDRDALADAMCFGGCTEARNARPEVVQCDCRLLSFGDDGGGYRWHRIRRSVAVNEFNGHTHLFLSWTDIEAEKEEEAGRWATANLDPETGFLNRTAFLREVPNWAARQSADFSGRPVRVAIAMIRVEDRSDAGEAGEMDREERLMIGLAKKIGVLLRADEMCCRYDTDMFALALRVKKDVEALYERMRLLYAALNAQMKETLPMAADLIVVPLHERTSVSVQTIRRMARVARSQDKGWLVLCASEVDARLWQQAPDLSNKPVDKALREKKIFVRTFGSFDVFVDGKAILFSHAKARELFALLVDRRGGFVTPYDAIDRLWEDGANGDTKMNRYHKAAMYMKKTLEANRVGEILEIVKGKRRIVTDLIDCDYYRYLARDESVAYYLPEFYLSEFSWAESTVAALTAMRRRK